jgi:hypothetical protein
MNEEEVKAKIVLPFLARLGLQASEITFEKSFSLRIGTNTIQVNGCDPARGIVRGRLDILIRRHNTNLLILELKETGHALSLDDRDQAISYARLVHPIAPYAVLTNGSEWKIFDTISKNLLSPEDFNIKDSYQLALPGADLAAASSLFLGYSVENLLLFCQAQVTEHLKPMIGSPQDLTKKYIPQLTTPRAALLGALAAFETAPSNGFLLLGDSGSGKTSALCDYVHRRLADRKPTIFFAGATLESGLLPAITTDFGWIFSEEITPIMLIRRLSDLAKDAPVVVVVDAIDEWAFPQRAQNLVNLLRGSRDLRVKFVISCRTAAWEGISRPQGSDIGFSPYLFCPTDVGEPKQAFRLGPLTDPEFYRAIRNYREVFKVNGRFEDKALNEARLNPFMLRVMFAVAAESGEPDLTFSSQLFFEKYLDLLIRKCGQRELAQAQLLALCRLMFDRNEECLSDFEVRRALSLSAAECLLPALFEQNILQRRGDGFAFYFEHLRSYLIAFKIYGWATAKPTDLAAVGRDGVRHDALAFYLRYATPEQIQAVTDPIWRHAHEYLKLYSALVTRYVGPLDRELAPGEGPELGFIAEYVVHRHMLGGYGFRRRKTDEPPVLLIPVDEFFSKSNLLDMMGAHSLNHFGSSNGFLKLDVRREVIENELIARVTRAIEQRRLKLRGSEKLASEALIAEIYRDQRLFEPLLDPQRRTLRFPIDVKAASQTIQRAKLRCHFENEMIEKKRRQGRLKESWAHGFVSYKRDISTDEARDIATSIEMAITTGKFPSLGAVTTNLRDLEEVLNCTGVFESLASIDEPPWPTEYGLSQEISQDSAAGLTLLREHVRNLYQEFFRAYRTVVDTNFPALKHVFPLRAQMPVRVFLDVELLLSTSRNHLQGRIASACERLPADAENQVVLCDRGELVVTGNVEVRYRDRLISKSYRVNLDLREKLWTTGGLLLTDMVYSRISREWPAVANFLRRSEGISIPSNEEERFETLHFD